MGNRLAKDAMFEALSAAARALGNGRRAELIDVLAQGERSVEELAGEIGQSVANTSQHLQQLLRAGLVHTRRDGNRICYSLASAQVAQLWVLARDVAAAHVGELEGLAAAYLGDRSRLQTITRGELAARLRDGDVVVVDVRPLAEYDAGHISGALSLPLPELTARLKHVPRDQQVVAYCRGPYCVFADDAIRIMRRRGYDAARLQDGYPEWQRAGLPTSQRRSTARHAPTRH